MRRRTALRILALSLAALAARAGAQQSGRTPVVGLLITHPPVDDLVVDYLREGLHNYGYEDGRNVKLEVRSALGHLERVPALAEELVRLRVDVIVVVNEIAVRAVMQATRTIPIVLVGYINEPVSTGWIESYRRPGGNLTGYFAVDLSLGAKRLEILKETLPGVARVVVLWDPAFGRRELDDIESAARLLGLELIPIEVRNGEDLLIARNVAKREEAGAALLAWSPLFWVLRDHVAPLFRDVGIPVISPCYQNTVSGGLLSYGSDLPYNWGRAAHYVVRILKGARVAEIPVEQAMRIKFAVSTKTAKALGLTIPQSILLRADEVIE
jgi:putative ABC transport system substrate-binding protein